VAQSLYFLALKTDMAQQQISETPEKVAADLKEMGQEARRVIREVRRTIFSLNPLDWSQEGFLPALKDFVERYAEQVDWQIEVDIDDKVASMPPSLEPAIFRLVQESLNNVAKHAEAQNLSLKLLLDGKVPEVVLRVADDGAGFSEKDNGSTGFGLEQMQARVEALGGEFSISSNAGDGTTVTARIPIPGGEYDGN
jgi:signal transduction histidine kinase